MIGLFRGVRFVLNSLSEVVEAELDDGERVKEELLELQMRLEVGEITDEEFAEVEKRYDTQYSDDQRGSLRTCGLYEQVKDKKAAAAAESEG